MKNVTKLVICSLLAYGQLYAAAELDTHNEPLANKAECVQWKKNIDSKKKLITKYQQKLTNTVDKKSRQDLHKKIQTHIDQQSNIEHNFGQECSKYNIK